MARLLITEHLQIVNSDIVFSYNEFGKPFIVDYPNLHFNISHSGDWVICGIGRKELGVDIEKIENDNINIAEKFFNKKEYDDLIKLSENDRLLYFYDLWTLKESYIKCIGKGLNIPLDSFAFKILKDNVILWPYNNLYNFKRYSCLSGYRVSICSNKESICNNIKKLNI